MTRLARAEVERLMEGRPDGTLEDDFLIIKQPGAVHVCNAPSPAATASLEIGKTVAAAVEVP